MDIQRLATLLKPRDTYSVPYSYESPEYANMLRTSAEDQFPYLKQHNIAVTINPKMSKEDSGYAETYPIGETGAPNNPAPGDIKRPRIEIFRPTEFTVNDFAAEGLHIDPYFHRGRSALTKTLSKDQIKRIQGNALDYQRSINEGLSAEKAMENTVDSSLRGAVFNQDQNLINEGMKFSPEQLNIINHLRNYAIKPR